MKMRERKCGSCTACCTALGVHELQKPVGVDCAHQCATGCKIYDRRPSSCAEYTCGWLFGIGAMTDRPDKFGVIFDTHGENVMVRELWANASRAPRVVRLLDKFAQHRLVFTVEFGSGGELGRRVRGPEPLMRKMIARLERMGHKPAKVSSPDGLPV